MAINKKLIHFKKKEDFLSKLENQEILDTSIIFIKDTKEIWTHGEYYSQLPEGLLTQEELDSILEEAFYAEDEPNNGYDYVDMGEAGIWATCNVGASKPEEAGNYYAWGEIKPKEEYTDNNYKFGTSSDLTKYNETDNLTTLELEDDAAHVIMGGSWRMPTKEELQKLIDLCDIEDIADYNNSSIPVFIFKLKTDESKKLIIPLMGYYLDYNLNAKGACSIWSSSLTSDNISRSKILVRIGSQTIVINNLNRCYGLPIRAILDPSIKTKSPKYLTKNEANNEYATKEESVEIKEGDFSVTDLVIEDSDVDIELYTTEQIDELIESLDERIEVLEELQGGSGNGTVDADNVVTITGTQTITGTKSFSTRPKLGTTTLGSSTQPIYLSNGTITTCSSYPTTVTNSSQLGGVAAANYVRTDTDQTITGPKTFQNKNNSGTECITKFVGTSTTTSNKRMVFLTLANSDDTLCTVGHVGDYTALINAKSGARLVVNDNGVPQFMDSHNSNIRTLIHTGNIGSQSVSYATSAGTATTATKANALSSSVTLWGRSFSGNNSISGSLSDVNNITPSSNAIYTLGTDNNRFKMLYLGGYSPELQVSGFDSSKTPTLPSDYTNAVAHSRFGAGYVIIQGESDSTTFMKFRRLGNNNNLTWVDAHAVLYLRNKPGGITFPNSEFLFTITGCPLSIPCGIIGTSTADLSTYKLVVGGNVKCDSLTGSVSSDLRLKENISENDYIKKLNDLGDVVDYNYTEEAIKSHENLDNKRHTGLIYQNVKDSDIPNLSAMDGDGHGFVNYYSPDLIATMIGAIQQLSKKVEMLEEEINELKSK